MLLPRGMRMNMILEDNRTITSITAQTHDETNYWTVGRNNVTKIEVEAIWDRGEMVPWFAISYSDDKFCRVNGAFVYAVDYKEMTDE